MSYSPVRLLVPLLLGLALLGGGLRWWSDHNQGAAAAPAVYVALGASDTVGVGADRPETEGWVPLVRAGLPEGTRLVNLGINGATLEDVLSQQLPVALDAQPDWVSIWPGVNDLSNGVPLQTFASQLNQLLDQLGQNRDAETRVIVLNIPDLRLVPAFQQPNGEQLDQTVRAWNEEIAAAADRHGAILVDLYTASSEVAGHPEDISSDGFHPSSSGYQRIADVVIRTIQDHAQATSS